MQGVNLDLLKTTPYRADGTPRDPHAHHQAEHLATLRAECRARWQAKAVGLVRLAYPTFFLHKYPGVRGSAPGPAQDTPFSPPRP